MLETLTKQRASAGALLLWLMLLWAAPANAEDCPAFFRFVDFGQKDNDGVVYRGGSILRAEGYDGSNLLELERTECLPIRDIGKDGHGNPIPVVTSIQYSPEKTKINLTELGVSSVDDTNAAAEKNAERHRAMLNQPDAKVTRGSNFLCANSKEEDSLSCQVVSPYWGNIALVVYCDASQCRMPVMAVDKQVTVNAAWPRVTNTAGNDELTGSEVMEMTTKIHDFLSPLTSLNPG